MERKGRGKGEERKGIRRRKKTDNKKKGSG